jgi:hypothetical protein
MDSSHCVHKVKRFKCKACVLRQPIAVGRTLKRKRTKKDSLTPFRRHMTLSKEQKVKMNSNQAEIVEIVIDVEETINIVD